MNNRGVAIRYGDVAPEAKENFVPTARESEFDTIRQLQQYNLTFPNYANPCELYQTVLDGTATAFPSVIEEANLGMWSKQITNDDGEFTEPIVLELKSVGLYSSRGLTLTFDTNNGIFATKLSIKWLRITEEGIITLDEKEFAPDDALYFCQNSVEYYNGVEITFYSLNMPKNRLKLTAIDYGYGTFFYGNELRNVRVIQEIDPVSTQISINTVDFTLDSKTGMTYSFQAKQPLSVYFNGQLKATTFVKSSKRQAKFLWSVQSEDYIGLMDSILYYGGIYTNETAGKILADIFKIARVPYKIDEKLAVARVTGYIPYTTCRNALMQVAFAIQATVDTSNVDYVNIYTVEEKTKHLIPLNRIAQGQNFTDDETVTAVEIAVHTYKPITDTMDVYDAKESGAGRNIFVKFNEPLHDLSITEGSLIITSGHNYAVIDADEKCVLTGQKYEHTTQTRRKNNPLVTATEIEKVASVTDATLVSQFNIDNLIEKCYNYLSKTKTMKLKIVEGKHVQIGEKYKYRQAKYGAIKYGAKNSKIIYDETTNVGETIRTETEYLGIFEGIILKQTFNLNGGIIIKDSTVK